MTAASTGASTTLQRETGRIESIAPEYCQLNRLRSCGAGRLVDRVGRRPFGEGLMRTLAVAEP